MVELEHIRSTVVQTILLLLSLPWQRTTPAALYHAINISSFFPHPKKKGKIVFGKMTHSYDLSHRSKEMPFKWQNFSASFVFAEQPSAFEMA